MKIFLAAAGFYVIALALTGIGYDLLAVPANEAFSSESARVEHVPAVDGRLGWAEHEDN